MTCSFLLLYTLVASANGYGSFVHLPGKKGSNRHASNKAAAIETAQPHLVLVLLDDLGWNGIGYHNKEVKTPFMNQFAEGGVKFSRYYTAPVCAPSRFSLLTGRRGWQSEAWGSCNFDPKIPVGTSPKYTMLPAVLKEAGYVTHMVGKWHQGFHHADYMPTQRGFDTFFGILGGDTNHYDQSTNDWPPLCANHLGDAIFTTYDLMDNNNPLVIKTNTTLGDDRYRKRAVELILAHNAAIPMFLYLSLQFPHRPLQVSKEYSSKYKFADEHKNEYYGMISHADDTVNHVVGALKKNKMYGTALVLVMSDNGAPFEGNIGRRKRKKDIFDDGNFPLKNGKGGVHEGGIRVPAFLFGGYLPITAIGQSREGLISVSDWFATLAHLAGAREPPPGPVEADSLNQWPFIIGESATKRTEVVEMALQGHPLTMEVALIVHNWKMLARGIGDNDRTEILTEHGECSLAAPCLFNLTEDPGEHSDVASSNTMIASIMREQLNDVVNSALSKDSWFGIKPDTGDWDERRSYYTAKMCKALTNSRGYLTPWADSTDENYNAMHSMKFYQLGQMGGNAAEKLMAGAREAAAKPWAGRLKRLGKRFRDAESKVEPVVKPILSHVNLPIAPELRRMPVLRRFDAWKRS